MKSISLAVEIILNGCKWLVLKFVSEVWLRICGITLLLFEFYTNFILTVYKISKPLLIDYLPLPIVSQLLYVIYGYSFAIPVALISAIYLFFLVFSRPYYKKPTDSNVPIPKTPPKCLVDEENNYGEHCFVRLKNIKLHYVDKKPTESESKKHLYVFLHGFPGFWFSWRNQIEYFSKKNRTVAVDLRGFGLSDKPADEKSYRLEYLVDDLKQLLDKINSEKWDVILVGHGWGALIIYEFLLLYPNYIHKYVTIAAPPPFELEITTMQIVQLWTAYFYLLPALPELYFVSNNLKIFDDIYNAESEHIVQAYKYVYGKTGSFTYGLNYFRANFKKMLLHTVFGCKIPKNTGFPKGLTLYSDNDKIIDPDVYEHISLKFPNLRTKELAGNHNPHEDIYRVDAFNIVVQFFIDEEIKPAVKLQRTSYRFIDTGVSKVPDKNESE